ncbi:hypothetical protein Hypma_008305 [Hypsizygus marmoreus]|uniref:Uncharacterized protein n=1 Tax=Hypsizygus marmoreus TaxID=39966 RepID=A0A369JT68_HYPMA|nr:hypothetical protein Hypma_008305 [Hypsizygus marmoreus]
MRRKLAMKPANAVYWTKATMSRMELGYCVPAKADDSQLRTLNICTSLRPFARQCSMLSSPSPETSSFRQYDNLRSTQHSKSPYRSHQSFEDYASKRSSHLQLERTPPPSIFLRT